MPIRKAIPSDIPVLNHLLEQVLLVHHKVRPNSLVINSMINNSKYGCLRTIHLSLFMKIRGKILGHFLYHERATKSCVDADQNTFH